MHFGKWGHVQHYSFFFDDTEAAEFEQNWASRREPNAWNIARNEIDIAKRNWEVQFYNGLLSIQRKADRLNSYNIMTGDPGYIQKDISRYLSVTPKSVADIAKQTLDPNKRVVLHITPAPKAPAKSGESK